MKRTWLEFVSARRRAAAVVVLIMSAGAVHAQNAALAQTATPENAAAARRAWSPPRTPDGQPDFQGIWQFRRFPDGTVGGCNACDIEPRAGHFAWGDTRGTPGMLSDPPDRKIPYQPWADARRRELVAPGYRYAAEPDPNIRCVRNGSPRQVYMPGGFQFLQTPGYVISAGEFNHNYRIIPIDGRPHLGKDITLFMGDSRGRWEGDTLVVDVTNQNGKWWLDAAGNFTSPNLRVTERFSLLDANTLLYEATLTEPTMYTKPWTMVLEFARQLTPGYEQLEHACHEGERSEQHILDALLK